MEDEFFLCGNFSLIPSLSENWGMCDMQCSPILESLRASELQVIHQNTLFQNSNQIEKIRDIYQM